MKQAIISLALVGIIIFELEFFNYVHIFDSTKNFIQLLKKSEYFLFFLQSTLVLIIISLISLYFMQKKIEQKKVVYNCSSKKSRSEYEKELKRETRKQVDALINSEQYRQHKAIFKTTDDFINQRVMEDGDDLSDILTESDSGNDSGENHQ